MLYPKHLSLCIFAILFCFLFSCVEKKETAFVCVDIPDSTMIDTAHYEIKKIKVGRHITNRPLSSQIVTIKGAEKYLLLDDGYIYVFDWESGDLNDSVSTEVCGTLDNYSGFTFISSDSIAVFNSAQNKVYIIDATGKLISMRDAPNDSENPMRQVPSICALNGSRIYLQGNEILLTGSMLGCLQLAKEIGINNIPITERLNIKSKEINIVATYPKLYIDSNWGTQYMNRVYTSQDGNGNILYSFPATGKVIRYNGNYSKCDTILMQSRYDTGIRPCGISQEKIEEDETLEIKYYISQNSYSHIIFDPYRNLYIRIAEHPLDNWSVKKSFVKPKSFIISDTNGRILSETPIIANSTHMLMFNMHVCKNGLAIAMDNPDENNIYFACLKIK